VGGVSCACVPAAGDSVVIDGYDIDIDAGTGNVTTQHLYVTNVNEKTKVKIKGGVKLTITGNLYVIAENNAKDIDFQFYDNNSELEVQGNVKFERISTNSTDKRCRLYMEDDTQFTCNGDFDWNWKNADGEDKEEIWMKDLATLDILGDLNVQKRAGQDSGNDEFKIKLENTSQINITGDFNFDQNGNYDMKIDAKNFSSITVGVNFNVSMSDGDDINIKVKNDATFTVTGDVTMDHNSSVGGDDMWIKLEDDAVFTIGGDLTMDNDAAGDDLLYFRVSDNSVLDVAGDISMIAFTSGSVELELNNSAELQLEGDMTRQAGPNNYGILDCNGTSKVTFNGAFAQVIGEDAGAGMDNFSYYNVVINNTLVTSPQLTLEGDVTINGNLTLTDGIIGTTSSEVLIIADNATTSEGTNASHVDGVMRKVGDDDFVFPLGDNGVWARLAIATIVGVTNEFDAEYFHSAYANTTSTEAAINNVSVLEYWSLERTVDNGGNPVVTLYWEDADASVISNLADLKVARFDDATDMEWKDHDQSSTTGGVGPGVSGTIVSNGALTVFGPLTFGSGSGANILPIELVSFGATVIEDIVEINWSTASESKNSKFVIERSEDGMTFQELGSTKGAGNSNTLTYYSFIDNDPLYGAGYYRLRQIDFDGDFKYTDIVIVMNDVFVSDEDVVNIFPNPVNAGRSFNIEYTSLENVGKEILVVLYDITGREVYSRVILQDNNLVKTAIDIDCHIAPGIYLVVGSDGGEIAYKEKLIIADPSGSTSYVFGR
ncbi:MAG: T9SS type A sorting domain-containing protein, partial [Bacteroidetes bacterium]|nr:T9SS type A sorting domain-containing protein [Bacteroidota bacterium]